MRIQFVNKEQFKTTEWSGGTTTEYFIYPENSDYGKRDFSVRISSAKMDYDYSKFTHLPGVKRYLSPLTDKVGLSISGENINLNPFEIVSFDGSDEVESFGQCRDFNLMLKDTNGSMESITVNSGEADIHVPVNMIVAVFAWSDVILEINDEKRVTVNRDVLTIIYSDTDIEETIKISSMSEAKVLICKFEKKVVM